MCFYEDKGNNFWRLTNIEQKFSKKRYLRNIKCVFINKWDFILNGKIFARLNWNHQILTFFSFDFEFTDGQEAIKNFIFLFIENIYHKYILQ